MAFTSRRSDTWLSTFAAPAARTAFSAAAIVASSARPCRTTDAPSAASAVAIPKPIPWKEPVTSARFPFSVMIDLHKLVWQLSLHQIPLKTCRSDCNQPRIQALIEDRKARPLLGLAWDTNHFLRFAIHVLP